MILALNYQKDGIARALKKTLILVCLRMAGFNSFSTQKGSKLGQMTVAQPPTTDGSEVWKPGSYLTWVTIFSHIAVEFHMYTTYTIYNIDIWLA